MRILQVTSSWKGGVIKVAFDVARALSRRGHKVTIYRTNLGSENRDLNKMTIDRVVNFHPLCPQIAKKTKLYFTPQMISRAIKVRYFDIIHLHGYRTFQNLIVYRLAKKYGVPYVLQAHGSLPRIMAKQKLKWIYDVFVGHRLLRDASKVIAFSQTEARQYKSMGVSEEKIEVIPNGIDPSEYDDPPPKGSFKKRFGIDDYEKIVLFLGRIHEIKGINFLIKSFARLVKNGTKQLKLVIAGPDDGYLSKAEKLACSLGISTNVLFPGLLFGEEKISAYVDSAVVVYPGRYEGFGLVSLEAAVLSKPIIVAKGTAMSRIIEKGDFGFSVKYGDAASLAESIRTLLENEDLASAMGKKGRRYVVKNFSWRTIVSRIEAVYYDVIQKYE